MVAAAMSAYLWLDYQHTIDRVKVRAQTLLERDLLYRSWGVSKGGIYIKVSENHQPNPHLAFLPNRDINLPDGNMLTLITPSNITHEAFELSNQAGETLSKITALKVVNPSNSADAWERDAINQFKQGAKEVSAVDNLHGKQYVRTMRPFVVGKKCVKCHSAQGYDVGQIRGGLSISIPLDPVLAESRQTTYMVIAMFFGLWCMGMVGISLQFRKLKRQTELALEHEQHRDHAETNLYYMTNYDSRTNLPNRVMFEKRMQSIVSQDSNPSQGSSLPQDSNQGNWLTVVTLEMKNFRQLQEISSENVGAAYLKICAERIADHVHPEDVIARLDENRLIFTLGHHEEQLGACHVYKDIQESLCEPVQLSSGEVFPVAFMGAAFYPNDASDIASLIKMSGAALDRSLEKGEGGFEMYSEIMQSEVVDRISMENNLRKALQNDLFVLHFQPQIDAVTGEMTGVEALLRMQGENGQLVPPDKFIPVAEESGLIIPIGEWVLRTACMQVVRMQKQTGLALQIGVNVSARQFRDPALPELVEKILTETGLAPGCLEIEITESTFIGDIDKTIETLTDLKIRGVQIALDDFGTGYSSLSYLNKFPIDRLKIDRSFVADISDNKDDRLLVGLIVEMGRKLGLNVIAEGVEDDIQKHLLIGMGCHVMQGFLFARPLAFDDFCDLVKEQSVSRAVNRDV